MQTHYNHSEIEQKWLSFWLKHSVFHAQKNEQKKPFTIVIPPPNITGILHMGHALNNTIQDVLIRYYRLQGREALWMPGTDHAGIATQNVVERQLARENKTKADIGRKAFLERLWEWQKQYGSTIIEQLKRLGASCDWDRLRFTMDERYSQSVIEVFVRLYEKKLIYRGNYIINWCPRCKTALSDEESIHREKDGWLYYIRYPLLNTDAPQYITVATTRPETMLGDTAVAYNPRDPRYAHLHGKHCELPFLNRTIPLIADDIVEQKFGTGLVKVTPAHDKNDFLIAQRHKLPSISIMNEEGILNEHAGPFSGFDRFKARQLILDELMKKSLLEKKEPYKVSIGHCYRCDTVTEPRLSLQWFVRMKPLASQALRVVQERKITFYPARWEKVYLNWLENINDWCISRQIWWGHRLPVYYCTQCADYSRNTAPGSDRELIRGIIVSRIPPEKCPDCGGKNMVQDEDVLDTWFSSWLWPFATFGWPFIKTQESAQEKTRFAIASAAEQSLCSDSDFNYFYPTNTLVTASEILFFWVARMIMAGLEFTGQIPFNTVIIHGTVRDDTGKKMSKSLGNIIDPLKIIDTYGADALRFSLIMLSAGGDLYLSDEKFLVGRNFANKIWNAVRFIFSNIETKKIELCLLPQQSEMLTDFLPDQWIFEEMNISAENAAQALEKYRFSDYAKILYEFFWHKFCDWYIEIAKINFTQETASTLLLILRDFLILLHPVMPFLTEELWLRIRQYMDLPETIAFAQWPRYPHRCSEAKSQFEKLQEGIVSVRGLKKDLGIQDEIKCSFIAHADSDRKLIQQNTAWMKQFLKTNVSDQVSPHESSLSITTTFFDVYLVTENLLSKEAYAEKIQKKLLDLKEKISVARLKIDNPNFLSRAPQEIIDRQKIHIATLTQEYERLASIRY